MKTKLNNKGRRLGSKTLTHLTRTFILRTITFFDFLYFLTFYDNLLSKYFLYVFLTFSEWDTVSMTLETCEKQNTTKLSLATSPTGDVAQHWWVIGGRCTARGRRGHLSRQAALCRRRPVPAPRSCWRRAGRRPGYSRSRSRPSGAGASRAAQSPSPQSPS